MHLTNWSQELDDTRCKNGRGVVHTQKNARSWVHGGLCPCQIRGQRRHSQGELSQLTNINALCMRTPASPFLLPQCALPPPRFEWEWGEPLSLASLPQRRKRPQNRALNEDVLTKAKTALYAMTIRTISTPFLEVMFWYTVLAHQTYRAALKMCLFNFHISAGMQYDCQDKMWSSHAYTNGFSSLNCFAVGDVI